MKLNIGAWDVKKEGWLAVDIDASVEPDIVADGADLNMIEDNSVGEVFASHVLEHMDKYQAQKALAEWRRVLKPDGQLHVVIPDICKGIEMYWNKKIDMAWIERIAYGEVTESQYQKHKQCYDEIKLITELTNAGFSNLKGLNYNDKELPVSYIIGWQSGITCRKPKKI